MLPEGFIMPKEDKDPSGNVSVYCFHVDIMLVLKARLFILHKITNERVCNNIRLIFVG
jgi:hypothetical protein